MQMSQRYSGEPTMYRVLRANGVSALLTAQEVQDLLDAGEWLEVYRVPAGAGVRRPAAVEPVGPPERQRMYRTK